MYCMENIMHDRHNNSVMDIAFFLVLSSLIISATLGTIIQMQKDMLASELLTQLSNSYKTHTPAPSFFVTGLKRQ